MFPPALLSTCFVVKKTAKSFVSLIIVCFPPLCLCVSNAMFGAHNRSGVVHSSGLGDVNVEGKLKKESEREEGGKCQSVVRDRHIRRDRGRKKKDIRNATCWLSG